jgi:hypothetical protein
MDFSELLSEQLPQLLSEQLREQYAIRRRASSKTLLNLSECCTKVHGGKVIHGPVGSLRTNNDVPSPLTMLASFRYSEMNPAT